MEESQDKRIYSDTKNGITVIIDECLLESIPSNFFEEYPAWFRYALHHGRYDLGQYENSLDQYAYSNWEEYKKALIDTYAPLFIFPVYMLDHSGLAFSITPFSNKWDSGQIGWAYLTEDDVLDIAKITDEPVTKESAEKLLLKELNAYESYCNGTAYYVCIIDKNGRSSTYTDFFGDDFNTNGIVDMIPEEFGRKEFLEDINKLTKL